MKIFDISQSTSDLIFNAANIGLIFGAAVVLVATIAAVWSGGIRERYSDLRISSNEKETAKANARAFEAQLALEKFKRPRSISVEQRLRIAEKMKEFSGQQFAGLVASDVADAWDVWREISLSLELAGWVRQPPQGLAVSQFGPPAGIALAPLAGVLIFSPITNSASENMRLYETAKALASRLTEESIIAGAGFGQATESTTISIIIGPKP